MVKPSSWIAGAAATAVVAHSFNGDDVDDQMWSDESKSTENSKISVCPEDASEDVFPRSFWIDKKRSSHEDKIENRLKIC